MKVLTLPAVLAGLLGSAVLWCAAAPVPEHSVPKDVATLRGHENQISGLAFSPDGKTLATCGSDGTVRLWGATSGKASAVLDAEGGASLVRFSPDGKTLAWSVDELHLWDLAAGKERGTFRAFSALRPVYAFTTTGKLLGAGTDPMPCGFTVWDADAPDKGVPFRGHPKDDHPRGTGHLAFSPDGKIIASCGYDKTVRLWDVASAKELAAFPQQPLWPGEVQFSPDGKVLGVGLIPDLERRSKRGVIRLLNVSTGKVLATLDDPDGRFGPFVFSPDGRLLAARYNDCRIKVWRLPEEWGTGK